jgi:hypothetical protein
LRIRQNTERPSTTPAKNEIDEIGPLQKVGMRINPNNAVKAKDRVAKEGESE